MTNIIKINRLLNGMSLNDLAIKANIPKSRLYRAEQRANPFSYLSYDDIVMLAKLFDMTAEEMNELNQSNSINIKWPTNERKVSNEFNESNCER